MGCEDEWEEIAQEGVTLCSFHDKDRTNCFDKDNIQQKVRVCSSANFERNLRIGLLIAIILTNCASLAASYRLNRLSNYVQLFLETKSVHRSAIFALVNSNKKEDNEVLEEMMLQGGIEAAVNRHNHAGDTPLGRACAKGDSWKVFLLWNAGAEPLVGRKPEVEEQLKKYAVLDIDGKPVRSETSRPLGVQHVVERNIGHTSQMEPLFRAWITSVDQEQGAAEQNILDLFESLNVNIVSVPTEPDGTDKHSIVEVAKRIRQWNSTHEQKLRATTPTGNTKSMREKLLCCFSPCQNEDQVWSDRKEALCSFRRQNITAVNISKSIRFNRIGSIRIR